MLHCSYTNMGDYTKIAFALRVLMYTRKCYQLILAASAHGFAHSYNLWQYRLGQSSFHMHSVVIYHFLIHIPPPPPSPPPPVSMLAPRIQTSDFCWPNIELGERGALFLSNYMKLQQLSHNFWQRLSWWWSMVFGIW
jgi:hypothetical protein